MPRAARTQPTVNEAVEITVEDPLGITRANARAQVFYHLVGLEHVAANLNPISPFSP